MTQGKGSTRRPQFVSDQVMTENWERAFGSRNRWIEQTGQLNESRRPQFVFKLDETVPDDCIGVMPVGDYLRPTEYHAVIKEKSR